MDVRDICTKLPEMTISNDILIDELVALTEYATDKAKTFKQLPDHQLNFKENPERWSILECIEHLNRYGDYYLPELEKSIVNSKGQASEFTSGVIGNWFANLMQVKKGKIIRMKTPADKNPLGSKLSVSAIDKFLGQQTMLMTLLNQARKTDLTRTKVPISLAKFMKLRLGDTFRFFVYHIERHIIQAENVRKEAKGEV